MTVYELSREELIQLKQDWLCYQDEEPSWYEMADADNIVSDETIFEEYGHYDFVPGDFFCNAH